MRIGIDASFLRKPGTGIGQVTFHFLQKLKENKISNFDIQQSTFILYTEEPVAIELPNNFEVKHFFPRWWKRDDVLRKWFWECVVATRAQEDGCDAFLSLSQSATVFHLGLKRPLLHIMIVHDIIPKLFPRYVKKITSRLHWRAVERGIRHAGRIIAISQSTRQDLIQHLGVAEEKISVAFPDVAPRFSVAVSHDTLAAILQKYHLGRGGYIYHGGGLEVRKNTEGVLRAYALLLKNTVNISGTDIPPLVISGKIFPKTNKLATDVEGLVEELGLKEKVMLLGFVPDEDMPALYRGALCFVYPSLYEGFGLPVLEALRMGTPILTSNVSSLPEVGGDAVLYCDPLDIDSIASGMRTLLFDETFRNDLISKSSAQAVQFSWETFEKKIAETLYI